MCIRSLIEKVFHAGARFSPDVMAATNPTIHTNINNGLIREKHSLNNTSLITE